MSANPFKKAERKKSFLNVAITGPSGSGKTWSALELATGMGGRIAVADTENGSAALYAKHFEFDHLNIHPPFTQEKYIRAVKAAVENGYDILIIDSFSHVWAGEGGVQDQKDSLDEGGGSKWANWKKPKALHKKVKDAILHSQIHVIATIRSKQGYVQSEEGSRSKVIKVGMDPIAEPNIEYEFTVVFDMDMGHNAIASKDRTHLFSNGLPFRPSKETGVVLMEWRNDAVDVEITQEPPTPPARQKGAAPAAMQRPARVSEPAAAAAAPAQAPADPGAFIIKRAKRAWEGRTIRDVVAEVGLDLFLEDVEWWATQSRVHNTFEIKSLKINAERFRLLEEEAAGNAEPPAEVELELEDGAQAGAARLEGDWGRENWPGDR